MVSHNFSFAISALVCTIKLPLFPMIIILGQNYITKNL